jgi:hypothetical protein
MNNFKSKLEKLKKLRTKIILRGHFTKFPTKSYPGRIYGEYSWDEEKEKWIPKNKT